MRKIQRRGLFNLLGTVFNRLIPTWLFRFCVMDVSELDADLLKTPLSESAGSPDSRDSPDSPVSPESAESAESKDVDLNLSIVTDPDSRQKLRQFCFNNSPDESGLREIGFMAKRDDSQAICGGVWAGIEKYNESDLGFEIELRDDQAWIFCAYVNKENRGQKVYPKLLSLAGHTLEEKQYSQMLVAVAPWNKASIKVHQKFQKRPIGRIVAIRFLSFAIVKCFGKITQTKGLTSSYLNSPILLTMD